MQKQISDLKKEIVSVQKDQKSQSESAAMQLQTQTLNELRALVQQHTKSISEMNKRQDLQFSNQKGVTDRWIDAETEMRARCEHFQSFCMRLASAQINRTPIAPEYFDYLVPSMLIYYPFAAPGTTSFAKLNIVIREDSKRRREQQKAEEKREKENKERKFQRCAKTWEG